ncbi:MAG TPA: hypothetical protein VMV52_10690 [Candidatus Nanopelagicaceae bacterium]|nr:hypothetical protein [Candidatus Nanopelagicaceae bacterium]
MNQALPIIEIHELVTPLTDDIIFHKISQLVISGMMAHMCIGAITRALAK